MKLIEKEYSYVSDLSPGSAITAGFTKNNLKGELPGDMVKALAFSREKFTIAYMNQVHGAMVRLIDAPGIYECDGLFTGNDNLALVIKTADCMPIMFYSEKENIIGAVHMGWRSAKEGILDNIKFDLSSFKVIAGPAMRKCCYEVGGEFQGYPGLKKFLEPKSGFLYFDPIGFLKEGLRRKGLAEENFFDIDICSYCSEFNFFSYRKTGTADRTLSFVLKK